MDEATLESVPYVGQKNLTIIGGGASANSVRMFTTREIDDYNYKLGLVYCNYFFLNFYFRFLISRFSQT